MSFPSLLRNSLVRAAFLAAVTLPGCMEPEARTCPPPYSYYCPAGSRCAARQAACIFNDCGDGVLQKGESCDDGNIVSGDGCSADCKSNETCGNKVVDVAMGEVCDDGNTTPGDGCSADCKSLEGCGNGTVDPGEDCDAGASSTPNMAKESPFCNSNCKWRRCGDGIVNRAAGEQCDRDGDGNAGTSGLSAKCNVDCSLSVCGDGTLNPLAGEACDQGQSNGPNRDCLPTCQPNVCGDLFVNETLDQFGNPKEECDLGGANSDTGACLRNCRRAACGDGRVWTGQEGCDEGPDSAKVKTECPYGQKTCTLCSACQSVALRGGYCGDGITQAGAEACDDGAGNGATACNYGHATCQICNADCSQRVDRTGPYCGDGIRNGSEVCDDGNNDTETRCSVYGVQTCSQCSATCDRVLPNLKGSYCGDGVVDSGAGEECDHSYSVACGTCSDCRSVPVQAATGSIAVVSTAVEGLTFAIDDGNASVIFELDSGGGCIAGNTCLSVSGKTTTSEIAESIKGAFGAPDLRVTASAAAGSSVVSLRNDALTGVNGNNPILITPASGALVAQGLAGGVGCSKGGRCAVSGDCFGGLKCKNNRCQ